MVERKPGMRRSDCGGYGDPGTPMVLGLSKCLADSSIKLARMRRSSLFKSTEALINNLIINTIETGAVTAIVAGAQLIMYLKSPNNFLHVVP